MRKLVLIGNGGHCRSVLDTVLAMKTFDRVVITVSEQEADTELLGCTIAGTDEILPVLKEQGFEFAFIAVGSIENAALRKKLVNMAHELGFQFPVICDPSACVSLYTRVGNGCFIGKNAVINADVVIGEHSIINTGVVVEHECLVGSFSHISVGAILCGNVHVGNESFIGAGSTVVQGVHIGDQVVIGANSTVLTNVENSMKVYGIVKNMGGYRQDKYS